MPFVGDFSPVSPGEVKSFSIDFSAQVPTGDSISSQSATVSVYTGADANAPALARGSPSCTGSVISQALGATAPNGFQGGVIYRWTVTATTASGQTLVNFAHIICAAIS